MVASGIRRLSVVERHNFDMQELAAAQAFEAYSLGASADFAAPCRVSLVEEGGVVVSALLVNQRGFGRQRHSRRCQQALVHSSKPDRC